MTDSQFNQLKKFITDTITEVVTKVVSEAEQRLSTRIMALEMRAGGLEREVGDLKHEVDGLKQGFDGVEKRVIGIEHKADDGFAGIAESIEGLSNLIAAQDAEIDRRLTRLEKQAA